MACPICFVDAGAGDFVRTLTALLHAAAADAQTPTRLLPAGTCEACLRELLDGVAVLVVLLLGEHCGAEQGEVEDSIQGLLLRFAAAPGDAHG